MGPMDPYGHPLLPLVGDVLSDWLNWRFGGSRPHPPQVIPNKQYRNTLFRSFQPLETDMGHSNQGSTTWKKRKNGQAFCTWAVKVEGKHHMPNMPICHVNCVTRASWLVSFQDVFRSKRYLDRRQDIRMSIYAYVFQYTDASIVRWWVWQSRSYDSFPSCRETAIGRWCNKSTATSSNCHF